MPSWDDTAKVAQAQGIVTMQADCTLDEALRIMTDRGWRSLVRACYRPPTQSSHTKSGSAKDQKRYGSGFAKQILDLMETRGTQSVVRCVVLGGPPAMTRGGSLRGADAGCSLR